MNSLIQVDRSFKVKSQKKIQLNQLFEPHFLIILNHHNK